MASPKVSPLASPRASGLTRRKEGTVSAQTLAKAEVAKAFIQQKYSKMKRDESERKEVWDLLQGKMEAMRLNPSEQEVLKREIQHKEAESLREGRKKVTIYDFEPLAIIGRGAFGEVRIVRAKATGEILALKKLSKADMLLKNQVRHIRAERDVLAQASNPWIVQLRSSFQDEKYLYLAMEYLPGGDFMTLLIKKDILAEEEARFYAAELVQAVESVHKMHYIHRDLKPDNVLLDQRGHLKLSDFGLCKHSDQPAVQPDPIHTFNPDLRNFLSPRSDSTRRQLAYSTVGTPDYIAPEVFGKGGYTETVDWWSVGVILFEMLVGYPPFFSDDPSQTCQKILHWRKTFSLPREPRLSASATDLIRRLIADPADRLGRNGVAEIQNHAFFRGVDWGRLRETRAPWVPEVRFMQVSNPTDTRHFDKFDDSEPFYPHNPLPRPARRVRKDVNFVGYSFKRQDENQRSTLVAALQELDRVRMGSEKGSLLQPLLPRLDTEME